MILLSKVHSRRFLPVLFSYFKSNEPDSGNSHLLSLMALETPIPFFEYYADWIRTGETLESEVGCYNCILNLNTLVQLHF